MARKGSRKRRPPGASDLQRKRFVPGSGHDEEAFFQPGGGRTETARRLEADAGVRIVPDSPAADRLDANALTRGDTIHFAPGKFQPASAQGRELIGHELAHVAQQRQGRVRPTLRSRGVAINTEPGLETEARLAGRAAAHGAPVALPGPRPPAGSGAGPAVVQGDFAVAPTVADPEFEELSADDIAGAVRYNSVVLTEADEISTIRDVLGISREPAEVNEDLVRAVARYQAQYGLDQDGYLGPGTAGQLADELEAVAARLGDRAEVGSDTRMAVAAAARRMRLRAQVRRRRGRLAHQEFVGDRLAPAGVVTAREGDVFGTVTGVESIEYTGRGAAAAEWLQFVRLYIYGFAPGSRTRVNMTGGVGTSGSGGGTLALSTPGTINWGLDSGTASPFYGDAGADQVVGRSNVMFDRTGGATGNATAATFAASQTPALDRVRMHFVFDAYLVRNDRVRYRLRWTATSYYDVAAGAVTRTRGPRFTSGGPGTGAATTIRAAQRTALDARFPANTVR